MRNGRRRVGLFGLARLAPVMVGGFVAALMIGGAATGASADVVGGMSAPTPPAVSATRGARVLAADVSDEDGAVTSSPARDPVRHRRSRTGDTRRRTSLSDRRAAEGATFDSLDDQDKVCNRTTSRCCGSRARSPADNGTNVDRRRRRAGTVDERRVLPSTPTPVSDTRHGYRSHADHGCCTFDVSRRRDRRRPDVRLHAARSTNIGDVALNNDAAAATTCRPASSIRDARQRRVAARRAPSSLRARHLDAGAHIRRVAVNATHPARRRTRRRHRPRRRRRRESRKTAGDDATPSASVDRVSLDKSAPSTAVDGHDRSRTRSGRERRDRRTTSRSKTDLPPAPFTVGRRCESLRRRRHVRCRTVAAGGPRPSRSSVTATPPARRPTRPRPTHTGDADTSPTTATRRRRRSPPRRRRREGPDLRADELGRAARRRRPRGLRVRHQERDRVGGDDDGAVRLVPRDPHRRPVLRQPAHDHGADCEPLRLGGGDRRERDHRRHRSGLPRDGTTSRTGPSDSPRPLPTARAPTSRSAATTTASRRTPRCSCSSPSGPSRCAA